MFTFNFSTILTKTIIKPILGYKTLLTLSKTNTIFFYFYFSSFRQSLIATSLGSDNTLSDSLTFISPVLRSEVSTTIPVLNQNFKSFNSLYLSRMNNVRSSVVLSLALSMPHLPGTCCYKQDDPGNSKARRLCNAKSNFHQGKYCTAHKGFKKQSFQKKNLSFWFQNMPPVEVQNVSQFPPCLKVRGFSLFRIVYNNQGYTS